MDETRIAQILKRGFPMSNVGFRIELLRKCLSVLGDCDEAAELDDDDLDMLAAAGDRYGDATTDEPRQ